MINFKPFSPKALDFIKHSNARLNILHGSVRSTKTVNCTVRWLLFLVAGPPGDLFMVGKTLGTLKRNVLNDIRDLVGPKNFHWVNRQDGELLLYNRRVYCIGANNEDAEGRITGATIAGAYCDEVNLYPEGFFAQLMARMSIPGAQCFCNCNPGSPYHWFYQNYIMNDTIKNKKIWHFTMDDNLSLDAEYRKSLEQMYRGVYYRRLILGEWCVAEGSIYDMFGDDCIKSLTDEKPYSWLVSCDYATSSVMTWSLIGKLADGRYYKRAEYYYDAVEQKAQLTDSQFGQIFEQWLDSFSEVNYIDTVYVDPSASSWRNELTQRGFYVAAADNDVINGIRVVSSLLENGLFIIDPSCKNTRKEYASYSWDPNWQRKGIDKPLKVADHTCDADRYALYTDSKFLGAGVYGKVG